MTGVSVSLTPDIGVVPDSGGGLVVTDSGGGSLAQSQKPEQPRDEARGGGRLVTVMERPKKITFGEMRESGVRGSLSKVIDSLAAGHPFSIVHLLEFENRRRILFAAIKSKGGNDEDLAAGVCRGGRAFG